MSRLLFLLITIVLVSLALFSPAASAPPAALLSGGTPTATPTPIPNIIVNSTVDVIVADDRQCTLREAITAANTDTASGSSEGECTAGEAIDTILIPAGTYALSLTGAGDNDNATGDLDILAPVTLRGVGASSTILDGLAADRLLDIRSNQVVLEGMTITNGYAASPIELLGGGIIVRGNVLNLLIRQMAIRNNRTGGISDPNLYGKGGGIAFASATESEIIRIEQSEISNNETQERGGGIYFAEGRTANIFQSTISGNRTTQLFGFGGGIFSELGNYFTVEQTTITLNRAYGGGGLFGDSILQSTILAGNINGTYGDCSGRVVSDGSNLIGNTSYCSYMVGEGDILNVDPLLQSLANNGGTTRTHALFDASPALDHGFCDPAFPEDQRGYPRFVDLPQVPDGATFCDIGSYEAQEVPPPGTPTATPTQTPTVTPTVTPILSPTTNPDLPTRTPTGSPTPLPPGDMVVNSPLDVIANDGLCTLREAVIAANTDTASGTAPGECMAGSGADVIIIPGRTYTLTRVGIDENSRVGDLDIYDDVALLGAGKENTIINGNGIERIIHTFNGHLTLANLTIKGGKAPNGTGGVPGQPGGGIFVGPVTSATLSFVRIEGNQAGNADGYSRGGDGGGIAHLGTLLTIENSEIQQNYAGAAGRGNVGGNGGGIYSTGDVIINRTTIDRNVAGNASYGGGGHGGGIYSTGTITVTDSTISFNVSGSAPYPCPKCGIAGIGGGLFLNNGTLLNSTVSGNLSGGGLFAGEGINIKVGGALTLTHTTISADEHPHYENVDISLYPSATVTVANTVLANIICGGVFMSRGYNFVGYVNGEPSCYLVGDTTGNREGDPQLYGLGDNLGSTKTHAFAPTSPLRDAGNCFGTLTDQRGILRPQNVPEIPNASDGCDMGAYEEIGIPPSPTPTITPSATSTPISEDILILYLPLIQR